MPLPTKFFRVTLPLATAATATIITAYLISSFTKELNKKKEEDSALENIELKSKEFEEELIQNDEGPEKDEKSASEHEEEKQEKDLDKDKAKDEEEMSAEEKAKQLLSEADQAFKAIANQKGTPEENEKQLQIEGKGQISQAEGDETVANHQNTEEQSSSSPPAKGSKEEKEAPQVSGKSEDSSDQKTMETQENELGTFEDSPEAPESRSEGAQRRDETAIEEEADLGEQEPSDEEETMPKSQPTEKERGGLELGEDMVKDPDLSEARSEEASDREKQEGLERSGEDVGSGDSDGTSNDGNATVENLEIYQDLKQQLLNQIGSMRKFFN